MIPKYLYISMKEDFFLIKIFISLTVIFVSLGFVKNSPQISFLIILFYISLDTILLVSLDRRYEMEDFIILSVFNPNYIFINKLVCSFISNVILFLYLICLCIFLKASILVILFYIPISFLLYQLLAFSLYKYLGYRVSLLLLAVYFISTLGEWTKLEALKYVSPGIQFVNLKVPDISSFLYLLLIICLLFALILFYGNKMFKVYLISAVLLFCIGFAGISKYENVCNEKISKMEYNEKIIKDTLIRYRGVDENYLDTYGLLTACLQNELETIGLTKYPIQITSYQLKYYGKNKKEYKSIPFIIENNIQKINIFSIGMLNIDYLEFSDRMISNHFTSENSIQEKLEHIMQLHINYMLLDSDFKTQFTEKQIQNIEFEYLRLTQYELEESKSLPLFIGLLRQNSPIIEEIIKFAFSHPVDDILLYNYIIEKL